MFRRAANYIARLEDALVVNGRAPSTRPPFGTAGIPPVTQISGDTFVPGLMPFFGPPGRRFAPYAIYRGSLGDQVFQAIVDAFPEQTRIFVCYHSGEPVAVALTGYFAGKVEGMWAGTTPAGHDLNANYILYWEMIKDACERGARRFHLGRSTAGSGAEQFKMKWAAESKQLYWYYHRPEGGFKPTVNVNHPSFQLGIAAWRKLPLWATRVIGPRLARNIP